MPLPPPPPPPAIDPNTPTSRRRPLPGKRLLANRRGARLERDAALREAVLSGPTRPKLNAGWSPAQVSGRLALEYGRPVISHQSIYRFIYAQLARTKDYSWRLYRPRGKSKRGWRGRRGGNTISRIPLS